MALPLGMLRAAAPEALDAPLQSRWLLIAEGGDVVHVIGLCCFESADNFKDVESGKAALPTWTKVPFRSKNDVFEAPVKVLVTTCRVTEPVAVRKPKNKAKWRISAEERAQVLNSVVVGTGQRLGDVDVQARGCFVWALNPNL